MIDKKIGFIGAGNMGSAILKGIVESKTVAKENIFVYDVSPAIREKMQEYGVRVVADNETLGSLSDVVILAVKPQYMKETLASAGNALEGKCVISIAAGLSSEKLREMIDGKVRLLRTMPNTPAMVYAGAFALCNDSDLTEEEKQMAQQLFAPLGIVEWVPEHLIDAVCGVSGSGPAYVAMFMEAMADGGVREGLPRATAYQLAAQTVMGTAKWYLESGTHPGVMKDMVTSPAGTTIAGCAALEKNGLRNAVIEAVHAGTIRSKELGD